MKKRSLQIIFALLILTVAFSIVSCGNTAPDPAVWDNAVYTSDTSFGNGAITVEVEVRVEENTVTFTLNTDKTTLGEALIEHSLISGEVGQYGLYVKVVNGITADYDTDKSYWSFYKNGEYLMSGVDTTEIKNGEHYEIVYTKE